MLRYALIALIAVVSAEDAITVTQSNPTNTPASAEVSCNALNDHLQGHTASEAVNGAATTSGASNEHLITISHGRCKLELKPTHMNMNMLYSEDISSWGDSEDSGVTAHIFHIDGAVADPALDSASHNGYFETQFENRITQTTASNAVGNGHYSSNEGEECDMDSHNRVEFQPVIDSATNNLQVTVILSAITSGDECSADAPTPLPHWCNFAIADLVTAGAPALQTSESGYEFKQYYDDVLLTAAGTNYAANSDSWRKIVNIANSDFGSTVVFTWASGCDDAVAVPSTCTSGATDVTCTHIVTGTNPDGLVMVTHATGMGHTNARCWVDLAMADHLTNAAACKCQCVV